MKSVTVTEYTDVAGVNNLIESLQSKLAAMTAQRDGLLGAMAVKAFDDDYISFVNKTLQPTNDPKWVALDLFAGCGGLALGFEAAGFNTFGFEADKNCCATYNLNLGGKCQEVFLDANSKFPGADIIIGGPPCQPFSVGGNQKGSKDSRNGFPAFISAVTQLRPKLFLFENVRGVLYKNREYFDEIINNLESLGYIVERSLMNAVNYLVPQNRERMIVVGHKGGFKFPKPMVRKVTAGEALGPLAHSAPKDAKYLNENQDRYIAKYEAASNCVNPRDLSLGKPARTLTCRNLAGATGDMQRVKLPDGRRRRLLHQEAARLQSFPDWFQFTGAEISRYNQIGNAVAPLFAYALAQSCAEYLSSPRPNMSVKSKGLLRKKHQSSFSFE